MRMLTIYDADHRAEIDDDLEGRQESAADDGETSTAAEIDAALAWLQISDPTDDSALLAPRAYPLRLPLDNAPDEVRRQIALTVENLADCREGPDGIAHWERITSAENFASLSPSHGSDCQTALMAAYDICEAQGAPANVLVTLSMMLAQRGCEHFEPSVTDGLMTHLCDIIIFG